MWAKTPCELRFFEILLRRFLHHDYLIDDAGAD